jgi:NADH dehydrogenase FAD-containing subunit
MLLQKIGEKITTLPATAQVALQQGKYVGKKFHKKAERRPDGKTCGKMPDEAVSAHFQYRHLGSLAYIRSNVGF